MIYLVSFAVPTIIILILLPLVIADSWSGRRGQARGQAEESRRNDALRSELAGAPETISALRETNEPKTYLGMIARVLPFNAGGSNVA
jgi:hypothetical protein